MRHATIRRSCPCRALAFSRWPCKCAKILRKSGTQNSEKSQIVSKELPTPLVLISVAVAGGLSIPPSFKCGPNQPHTGLKVKPKRGLATLFYSLRPDGAPDPFSLHGGCPPENDGTKCTPSHTL